MFKPYYLYSIFLVLVVGSGCSKNDPSDPSASERKTAISLAPVNKAATINMGHDPDQKFQASHTTINSFQSSNTYNNYGFAYVYERRSGDGQVHYYKSIQEIVIDTFSNQKNILAETWVEISQDEWLQSEQHYKQHGELTDLEPEILQATGIYQKRQQFLQQLQLRQQQFEKERTDFEDRFKQRKAEFDAKFEQHRVRDQAQATQQQQSDIATPNHETEDQAADSAPHESSTPSQAPINQSPHNDTENKPAPESSAEDTTDLSL